MRTLKMYPTSINEKYIDQLIAELRDGGMIIYPTDSYYAIGCDALNNRAVERICKLKGINPQKNTLAITCCSISQAAEYARIDNDAFRLLKSNLPGPFTFILPASSALSKQFKGRKQVGVRVPDNAIARRLAEALGTPLLTTSIISDNGEPMLTADEIAVRYQASEIAYVVDAGDVCGEPSTIVELTDSKSPVILREGKGELNL